MLTRRQLILTLLAAPALLTSCSSCGYKGDVAGAVEYAQKLGKYDNKTIEVTGYHSTVDYKTSFISLSDNSNRYSVSALFANEIDNPKASRITVRGRLISAMTKPNQITISDSEVIE